MTGDTARPAPRHARASWLQALLLRLLDAAWLRRIPAGQPGSLPAATHPRRAP